MKQSTLSPEINRLFGEFKQARTVQDEAYNKLREAALDEYPIKVGDKVKIGTKIGRVKSVQFKINWQGDIEISVFAYPIKKDGTTARIGEIRSWFDVELLERP